MAVHGRQVLAPGAVDVQLDRHGLAPPALDHAQRHRLLRGRDRVKHAIGAGHLDPGDGDRPAGQVETSFRVGGVFEQDLAGRQLGKLIVVGLLPVCVRVEQARRGRDHLAQVNPDLLEQAVPVQLPLETLPLGQPQASLAPRQPTQGLRGDLPGRDGRYDRHAGRGLEAQADDRLLRPGVLPGPQPVDPRAIIRDRHPRLCPAPIGRELLLRAAHRMGFAMGDGFEAILTPMALKGADLVAAADDRPGFAAVGIADHVVGGMFGQPAGPSHRRDEAARSRRQRTDVRRVQEDQPTGHGWGERDRHRPVREDRDLADLKRNAPRDAAPAGRVAQGCRHLRGYPERRRRVRRGRQPGEISVPLEGQRGKEGRTRAIVNGGHG